MKNFTFSTILIAVLSLISCASKYNYLNPESVSFSSFNKNDSIKVSYEYMQLRKKYAKKADKNDIKIASIKIQNNTNKAITYENDFRLITSNNNSLPLMHPNDLYQSIKQKSGSYFLYLLLSPMQLQKTETNDSGVTETENIFPIGLILGPAIALGNYFTASGANKKFKNEFDEYSIYNKQINPGETKVFLVPIRSSDYPSINAQLIN